jgi:hypothetical protein
MRTKLLNIVPLVLTIIAGSSAPISGADTGAPAAPNARDLARTLTLPEFKLEAVSLEQAFKQLQEAGKQHDTMRQVVNFCLLTPVGDKTTRSTKISLNLKNVSLLDAAEQVCQQVGGFEIRESTTDENCFVFMLPKRSK